MLGGIYVNQLDGGILSQCIYLSNNQTVHFKYLIFVFVNCLNKAKKVKKSIYHAQIQLL